MMIMCRVYYIQRWIQSFIRQMALTNRQAFALHGCRSL